MAQLDNAADSDSEERGFKSLRAGQKKKPAIPYVSRDCRLFSTDEGVNDFLNWLKEDSGYSKAEKKTVLQRIIDFFDRIIEAIKDTIQNGELSKTAREFAQMQADKAAQIREMFLDALDGINGKKRKNAGSETKDSRKKSYVSRDGHFLSYRETGGSDAHEQALRWASQNDVEDGDKRLAYCKGAWYIIEKDSNDYAEYQVIEKIRKGEYDNERRKVEEYNRRNKRRTISGEFAEYDFGSEQRVRYGDERYGFDINGTGYETKSGRVLSLDRSSSQRGKTRIDTEQNTFGGNENRTGNGTERLTDSEIKNSLKQTERDKAESTQNKKRLYNESDTLFLQWSNSPSVPARERKMFKRGKDLVLFEKTKNGCVELFRGKTKNEVRKYEQAHGKTDDRVREIVGEIRSDMGGNGRNNNIHRLSGNVTGNGGQTGSERLQTDSERDNGHLLSGNGRISDITDSEETKNSLRHSLGISDNTAEVASYYGFAAVFAALVASEAADVVDSALAAVVEFVAAALDVAVDSSAEKVPAVEDNSAKADEVSPEFSAGNDVESVDELFCVPFNLKAFRKPFTPRPK